jgi:hypothetical protein
MAIRHFAFTVTVTDSGNHLVEIVNGRSEVHNDVKSPEQISRSIVDDLPGRLRRPGYSYNVNLTAL